MPPVVKMSAGGLRVKKEPLVEWEMDEGGTHTLFYGTEARASMRYHAVSGGWAAYTSGAYANPLHDERLIVYVSEDRLSVARATAQAFYEALMAEASK